MKRQGLPNCQSGCEFLDGSLCHVRLPTPWPCRNDPIVKASFIDHWSGKPWGLSKGISFEHAHPAADASWKSESMEPMHAWSFNLATRHCHKTGCEAHGIRRCYGQLANRLGPLAWVSGQSLCNEWRGSAHPTADLVVFTAVSTFIGPRCNAHRSSLHKMPITCHHVSLVVMKSKDEMHIILWVCVCIILKCRYLEYFNYWLSIARYMIVHLLNIN